VKRLASALAAGCLIALVAVAAPAFSSGPWRPAPVDFELAPSSGAVASAAGHAVVTKPLRAPKRFNLVGMRWRGAAAPRIAVRTRRAGGGWSRWTPLEAKTEDGPDPGTGEPEARGLSAPAWVGEADEVQLRLTRRVPGLRLHFVNVEGTATAADRTRTAVRRAAHAAVVSVAGLFGGTARAQSGQPAIVPRGAWGADKYCLPRAAPEYGEVKAAFVHHTVNPNDYTRAEAPDIVLGICRYHRNSNGWNDIGYNFLVDRFGTIYEGRAGGVDQPVMGAQAQGYNSQSTGIANIGTFSSVPQTGAALQAMASLIRWKLPLHGVPTYGGTTLVSAGGSSNRYPAGRHVRVNRIAGHRDVDSTECPGNALYAQLPELRRLVGQIDASGLGTRLSMRLSTRKARYRSRVRVAGTLRDASGAPQPGRAVAVERLYRRVWRPVARATTSATGSFRVTVRPHASRRLRARFLGDGQHHPSRSRSTVVWVRAAVSISHPAKSAARRSRVPVRGAVKPRKRRVWLVLQQRRGERNRKLGARAVRVRKGRFRTSFTPARTGLYRFYVVAKADRATVRGSSGAHLVRVRRG
jgi:N-acetylmuramoyl-L-alanine amidase-like protein